MLTENEFWQLRGLLDAHGEAAVAAMCKLTVSELVAAIYPGADASIAKVREVLRARQRRQA